MTHCRTTARLLVVLAAAALAKGCGDADSPSAPPPDPPRPTTITVTPATADLAALGATVQLTAEVRDQNGSAMAGASVSWASSASGVATVSASGLVTATGNGTATVTATSGSASGSAAVTVGQEVAAVTVTPSADTLVAGDTLRLAAGVHDANGHPVAGAEIAWASGDTAVARVDSAGLVTGVSAGETTVTAASGSVAGEARLTVAAPAPTTLTIAPEFVSLSALGDTVRLSAEVLDQIGRALPGAEVVWSSADTAVASVDSAGLVTASGTGETTVTAVSGGVSGEARVSVMQAAGSVVVSPAVDTIAPGDTLRLVAEAFDRNGHRVEGVVLDWSSSDGAVASVDNSGLVEGIAVGRAAITAASGDALGTSEITVENPDRAALVALYEATGGPNWLYTGNWLTDAPLGEWWGVIPNRVGRVTELILGGNNLSGPMPPELGDLGSLEGLHLYGNDLSGSIPPELGQLTRLRTLDLRDNDLSGQVPPELMDMAALEQLRLVGNRRLCAPEDREFLAWLLEEHGVYLYRCGDSGVRRLPSALMREDGNGMSLALPDDLRNPSAVTVSDPSVVSASAVGDRLELSPRSVGSTEVEVASPGSGPPAVVEVWVRAAVGTFGIDLLLDQPAPLGYEREIMEAADWWSYLLDGTEWPDRQAGCPSWDPFRGKAEAQADELLIGVRVEDIESGVAGYFSGCFFPVVAGGVPALDPGGGYVVIDEGYAGRNQILLRHEIAHALGLVSWSPDTGLTTADCGYFTGPRAVEAFRASGGNPDLPGVPTEGADGQCGGHWGRGVGDFMAQWWHLVPGCIRSETHFCNSISLGALVDAGYTIDLSKATPPQGVGAAVAEFGGENTVFGKPRVFVERRPRERRRH